jgi:hypothetical protein
MDFECLEVIFNHTIDLTKKTEKWKCHRVVVIDGTGLSMPDTPEISSGFFVYTRAFSQRII